MKIYLVGGAVRDQLLNRSVKDRDWVVVGATPQQMLDLGYKQVGADFPVFLHPKTQEEYALARTERKQGHGYQGFSVSFGPDITLEDDLLRRDLTINAMAQDEQGNLIDPYNGQKDLSNRVLRHVSDAFIEDPLRVLRVARFAARYAELGFTVADETVALMRSITHSGELAHLTAERVWQETERALLENKPDTYFNVLRACGALAAVFPEVDALFGVPQPEKHHPEIDTGVHTLMCLQQAAVLSAERESKGEIRFATLLHDLGKARTPAEKWPQHIAHEATGLKPITALCDRLRAPNRYRELALKTCEFHTHVHRAFELKPATVWKLFRSLDALRKPDRFEDFLLCCTADARGRTGFETRDYPQADYLRTLLVAANQVSPKSFVEQGLNGAALGEAIEQARIAAIAQAKQSYPQPQKT